MREAQNVGVINDGDEQWAAMHAADYDIDDSAVTAMPSVASVIEGKSVSNVVNVDNSPLND